MQVRSSAPTSSIPIEVHRELLAELARPSPYWKTQDQRQAQQEAAELRGLVTVLARAVQLTILRSGETPKTLLLLRAACLDFLENDELCPAPAFCSLSCLCC